MFKGAGQTNKAPFVDKISLGGCQYFDEVTSRPRTFTMFGTANNGTGGGKIHRLKGTTCSFVIPIRYAFTSLDINFDSVKYNIFSDKMPIHYDAYCLSASSSNDYLALAYSSAVIIYSRTTGEQVKYLYHGASSNIVSIAFNNAGTKLAIGTAPGGAYVVAVFDITNNWSKTTLSTSNSWPYQVFFSNDDAYLWAAVSSSVYKWRVSDWSSQPIGFTPAGGTIMGMMFSSDGNWMVVNQYSTGADNILIYRTDTMELVHRISGTGTYSRQIVQFSPDSNYFAAGGSFTPLIVLNVSSWTSAITATIDNTTNLEWTSDSANLIVTTYISSNPDNAKYTVLRMSDSATYTHNTFSFCWERASSTRPSSAQSGRCNDYYVSSYYYNRLYLYSKSGKRLSIDANASNFITDVAISPDGKWIARGQLSLGIAYSALPTTLINTDPSTKPSNTVYSTTFRPDSKQLIITSGAVNNGVYLYDTTNGFAYVDLGAQAPGSSATWSRAKFSSSGTHCAISAYTLASTATNLKIYSVNSNPATAWTYTGYPTTTGLGYITNIAWSPDGTRLAVAHSISPYVRIYNTSDWTYASVSETPATTVGSLIFNKTGSKLICGIHILSSNCYTENVIVYSTSTWTIIDKWAGIGLMMGNDVYATIFKDWD
jgi:hypothetical protein